MATLVLALAAKPRRRFLGSIERPRPAGGANPEPAVLPQEVLDGRSGPVAVSPLRAQAQRLRPPRPRLRHAAVACSAAAAAVVLLVITPRLGTHTLGTEPEVVVPRGAVATAPVAAATGEDDGVVVGPCNGGGGRRGWGGRRRRASARRRGAEVVPPPPCASVARGEGL